MSAPVTERQHVAVPSRRTPRRSAIPAQRVGEGSRSAGAGRSAAQRAYARRDDRLRRLTGARPAKQAAPTGRAQFVLLVMVLLGSALVATLWLSTAAAADSYRLQDARTQTRDLTERSELLRREVTAMDAAPALARRAAELGLVPVADPARLVVGADGAVTVVGRPQAAHAAAPPPAPPAPPAAAGTPAAGTPVAGAVAGAPAAGAQAATPPAAGTPTDPALTAEAATQTAAEPPAAGQQPPAAGQQATPPAGGTG